MMLESSRAALKQLKSLVGRRGSRSLGQSSMEFLAFVSLSALMLAGFHSAMVTKQGQVFEYQNTKTAERVAEYVSFQAEMALVQGDGYSRVFSLPERLGGRPYTVELFNGTTRVRWGNQSAIQPNRYRGKKIEISTGETNVFRVVNDGGEVNISEE